MSLRLLCLVFPQLLNLLLLPGGSPVSKDARLPVLRHELAVLRGANPKSRRDWADRAVFAGLVRALPTMPLGNRLLTPGTILRLYRRLAAGKGTDPHRVGRPPADAAVASLIERMARENTTAGDTSGSRASYSSPVTGEDQHRNRNARLALPVQISRGAPGETHAKDPK